MSDDIWIVTRGEYSSYEVIAGFSTDKLAMEYAAAMNANEPERWDSYRVERIDLDPPTPEIVRITQPPKPEPEPIAVLEERCQRDREETEQLIDSLVLPEPSTSDLIWGFPESFKPLTKEERIELDKLRVWSKEHK